MSITSVNIQNFRSIVSFKAHTRDLNIFVGQNDEGKSNVLRALDLFFNHDKKTGFDLVWERDYCRFAPERQRKAPEITIELEVVPPESFSKRDPVFWRRVWRSGGFHSERIRYKGGEVPGPRSKVGAYLKAMRFDYVPAIKGPEFFQQLLSSLHDMLEATVEEDVRSASSSFTKTINKNTKTILSEIESRLGLPTTIELPPNLRDLFAQLEFTSKAGDHPFSLSQRGDGVKVRHVPIVLRWLAEQANHLSVPGKPKVVTVWGYEEPENNLEIRRCLELAREFIEFCPTIQSFVTTHSPAFYSICREADPDQVQLFSVEKAGDPPVTDIEPVDAVEVGRLDSSMGLLEFLAPHMKQAHERIAELEQAKAELPDTNTPTVFVEGPSDKAFLEMAIAEMFPDVEGRLQIRCANGGGGHNWVKDMLLAWHYGRANAMAVGLFDKDSEAVKSRREAQEILGDREHARAIEVCPSSTAIECFKAQFKVPISPDELLNAEVWSHAEQQGWLEKRSQLLALYGFQDPSQSFTDFLEATVNDEHQRRLIMFKISAAKKEDLCKYVRRLNNDNRRAALEGLEATVRKCLETLGIELEGGDE